MTARIRRTRLIDRGAEPVTPRRRDVYLVVVATEDRHAAKQYFDALQARGLVDRSRVEIVSLPTIDGHSSLGALVNRLKDHRDALDVRLAEDEYWAVFDVDQQKAQGLTEAMRVAKSRGQRLAGSNPCFELWLLLHLTGDITGIPSATEERRAARICEQRLHDALQAGDPRAQGYDKSRIHAERFAVPDRVRDACARAGERTLPGQPWPMATGTHVHLLVERLPVPMSG